MTKFRLLSTVALAMCMALPATAKGPESATLDGPGIVQPIVFLDQRRSFSSIENQAPLDLMGMTGLFDHGRTETGRPTTVGPRYTVTWVMMGTNEVIVQHLYPEATGGPVIHTPEQTGLDGWGADVIGWFEAPDALREAIHGVLVWTTTPTGLSMQPMPPARSAGSLVLTAVVVGFAIAGAVIFLGSSLRRTRLD